MGSCAGDVGSYEWDDAKPQWRSAQAGYRDTESMNKDMTRARRRHHGSVSTLQTDADAAQIQRGHMRTHDELKASIESYF